MRRLLATAAALAVLAGCAGPGDEAGDDGSGGRVVVFAAASLTGAFQVLGDRFERANPGTEVVFNFGPSSGLATQIAQGAPADVFASASPRSMEQVADAVTPPRTFARNSARIAVPPGNPAGVATLADLARPGVKVALCAEAVPCGSLARQVLAKAGVRVTPVTTEVDVKATLSKVQLGEVDAGIVYVTDVEAAGGRVVGVPIPAGVNASTDYPIATVAGSADARLAAAFRDLVLSAEGAAVLAAAGFDAPG